MWKTLPSLLLTVCGVSLCSGRWGDKAGFETITLEITDAATEQPLNGAAVEAVTHPGGDDPRSPDEIIDSADGFVQTGSTNEQGQVALRFGILVGFPLDRFILIRVTSGAFREALAVAVKKNAVTAGSSVSIRVVDISVR